VQLGLLEVQHPDTQLAWTIVGMPLAQIHNAVDHSVGCLMGALAGRGSEPNRREPITAAREGRFSGPVVDEDTATRLGQDYNEALRAHLKVATGEGRMPSRAFLGNAAGPMMMVQIAF
jgi:hypothetical protein